MAKVNFKPKKITSNLIDSIGSNERAKEVLTRRFGLGKETERKTLDAIGQGYGITRERVRQIENFAINKIKQNSAFEDAKDVFAQIKDIFEKNGKIVAEHEILDTLADDQETRNHFHFLLVLGDDFTKLKEDDYFHHRWTTDSEHADKVHAVLDALHSKVTENDLYNEKEFFDLVRAIAKDKIKANELENEAIRRWLGLSKIIDTNNLGEWGHVDSSNINPRGMRDYAFLVLRKHGEPLHFTEIAKKISGGFERNANASTVHNELIKDDNFVLVGRGLYGLKDWGYRNGTVRDIIEAIIKANGPLTKEEIISAVLKERYIKENTVLVNLQNQKFFTKNKNNKYAIASGTSN